jgi:hypothetical protein
LLSVFALAVQIWWTISVFTFGIGIKKDPLSLFTSVFGPMVSAKNFAGNYLYKPL